jgi:hypothetical protein
MIRTSSRYELMLLVDTLTLVIDVTIICELVIKNDVYDYGFDYYQAYY